MDWTERVAAAMTLTAMVLLAGSARKVKPVEIRVSPRFGFAPAKLTVTVHVEPNPDNRVVEWVIEGDTGYRAGRGYDPEAQPLPTMQIVLPSVPAGHYQAVAFLTDAKAKTTQSEVVEVCVTGSGISCASD